MTTRHAPTSTTAAAGPLTDPDPARGRPGGRSPLSGANGSRR